MRKDYRPATTPLCSYEKDFIVNKKNEEKNDNKSEWMGGGGRKRIEE